MSDPASLPTRTLAAKLRTLRASRKLHLATDREHAADVADHMVRLETDPEYAAEVARRDRDLRGDASIERQLKPLPTKDIAAAVGITPSHVGYLLSGARDNPSLRVLQKWADLYEVPVAYLVENDETDLMTQVEQDLARDRTRANTALRTISDRFNGLIDAIHPSGGDTAYTDDQLAAIADCTPDEVRGLRAGADIDIGIKALQRLAALFDVTVGYLVDGVAAGQVEQRVTLAAVFDKLGVAGVAARQRAAQQLLELHSNSALIGALEDLLAERSATTNNPPGS
jgi:transcriptional regulator with XRE-family HTH domain